MTIAAVPVHREAASGVGHHAAGRHGPVVGFLEKPKTDEELDIVRTDPAWIDAHGIRQPAAATAWPAWASTCSTATRWSTCCGRPTYRDFGKEVFPALDPHPARAGPSVRRLLGRHRHDQVVLRGQPGHCQPRTRRSIWPCPSADLLAARFLPPTRIDGATVSRQPDRRRLP